MSLARDITTVGSGTLVSRLLAYVRDAWIAALLGAGPFSETLFAVLQVVNFFRRLLSEGALNGAFVPIWIKLHGSANGAANANRFTWRVLLMMFCVVGSIALLAVFLGRYVIAGIAPGFDDAQQSFAAFLLFLTAPYILLAGLVAVLAAALSAEGRVGVVAVTTVLFNLTMLLALLLLPDEPIERYQVTFWITLAVTAAGMVQFLTAATVWSMTGRRWQRARSPARDQPGVFFARALPGLIATSIPQLKLIAATAIVSASPAAVSWLYYANRLYELPLGVASIAVAAVIVPRIAGSVHARNESQFASAQSRAYEIAVGLALPAATGFALLAVPIARGLFERGAFGAQDTPLLPRWWRFLLGFQDTYSRRYSARFHSRTKTRMPPCLPALPVSPRPSSAACCCLHGLGTSVSRQRLPCPAGSGPGCSEPCCFGAAGCESMSMPGVACLASASPRSRWPP